ncbi:MAG: ATP-grasp domain-containing protein [Acidimicrobiia bacterium]
MSVETIREVVQERIATRPVILAGTTADRFAQHIYELRMLGAERVLVVTNGPTNSFVGDGFDHLAVEFNGEPSSVGIEQAWHNVFENTPSDIRAVVDRFDPNGEAVVIPWRLRRSTVFAGRPVYGPRHPSAVALEDKTRFVEMLADLGIPQPPGAVTVRVKRKDLIEASRALDQENGVVWSGDSATASASGGKYVRHIRNSRDVARAMKFYEPRCEYIRVAPFVEGVTGGMHAIVHREHTVVMRPTEQIVLRGNRAIPFELIGLATMFDPHPYDREQYREMVRTIGNEMHRRLGYEGLMSVDAILSKDGWVVHDLNPRPSAGLVYLKQVLPELPIQLLHHVVAEGEAHGINWQRVEHQICAAADLRRVAIVAMSVPRGSETDRVVRVHLGNEENIDVQYHPTGGEIRLRVDTVAGEPVAPKVALSINAASEFLGLGLEMSAPKHVRERITAVEPIIDVVTPELESSIAGTPLSAPSRVIMVPEPEREPEHRITLERLDLAR